jgi:pyruvate kinase
MHGIAPMNGWDSDLIDELISKISELRSSVILLEDTCREQLTGLAPACAASARNLLHYLALRSHDIRQLQEQLAPLGLSSLGRAESCVLANLDAVQRLLYGMRHEPRLAADQPNRIGPAAGRALLERRTEELLGAKPRHRSVRIMVTMPSEAAQDYHLVRDVLAAGMDCMRINCAHDDASRWAAMVDHLHRAEKETGKQCRILMDVPGPKLRTGPLEPGPQVVKWRPRRDCRGRVTAPARIWLVPAASDYPPPAGADASVPVVGAWLDRLATGDEITIRDARGSKRTLRIAEPAGPGRWAESDQTAYLVPGTRLRLRKRQPCSAVAKDEGIVGELPALSIPLVLRPGDTLILTTDLQPGRPARLADDGMVSEPARIGFTCSEVFADLRPGHHIWFDDGKIGGVVREVASDHARIEITYASAEGSKLGADKGINLPDTLLHLPALTPQDLDALDFIAAHADLVGFSFVHSAAGVTELQEQLKSRGGERLGIILKIETPRAFEHLPELLLAALRSPSAGVMIARGDLAVECGYERLAELQEEILWICEAAHVPVIWATQVLETLAKQGMPSRAEITDAAMGERAECVMLNKGPHILDAVRVLDDILRRMEGHQSKKRATLRRLHLADRFRATAAHADSVPGDTKVACNT